MTWAQMIRLATVKAQSMRTRYRVFRLPDGGWGCVPVTLNGLCMESILRRPAIQASPTPPEKV